MVKFRMRHQCGIEVALRGAGPGETVDKDIRRALFLDFRDDFFLIARKRVQHALSMAAHINEFGFPAYHDGVFGRINAKPVGATVEIRPVRGNPFALVAVLDLRAYAIQRKSRGDNPRRQYMRF